MFENGTGFVWYAAGGRERTAETACPAAVHNTLFSICLAANSKQSNLFRFFTIHLVTEGLENSRE
jgi:hypothetical protein